MAHERTSDSIWLEQADTPDSSPPPSSTTVAVIGAGIAGVSTALHLASAGVDVTVLEAGDIAGRASGRNDGQLLLGLGEHYNRIHSQFGAERAPLLWDFLQRNHDAMLAELRSANIDCDLRQAGGLRLAETEHEQHELRQAAALLRAEDRDHELLEADDVAAQLPLAQGFHGGLRLADEAIVQPASMVRGLALLAQSRGATIATSCEVRAVQGEAGALSIALASDRD